MKRADKVRATLVQQWLALCRPTDIMFDATAIVTGEVDKVQAFTATSANDCKSLPIKNIADVFHIFLSFRCVIHFKCLLLLH
jgi:hypothetical protein